MIPADRSNQAPWGAGWLAGLAALLAAAVAAAAPPATLRVGTSGDYPPFSSAGSDAPPALEGFDISLARAYAEERGLQLEFVPFRWPTLLDDLAAKRFDVAMSGVTVRPERSVAGRFSVPVAEGGAVVLVRQPNRASDLDGLDRPRTRLGVNAGGHLERVTRARFKRATLVFIPDNAAVLAALRDWSVDAVVTDTFEAPLWIGGDEELTLFGPFTHDRKAYLVRTDRPGLAADLDAWLLAREADGSLAGLRHQHLGAAHARAVATPLASLLAASDERLALMPLVAAAKRRAVLPLEDRAQEAKVLEAAVVAVAEASQRTAATAPPEAAVRAFLQAQIEAAKQVQLASGRDPDYEPPERLPDLESELRPALLRIGRRIAALLLALPPGLDASAVHQAAREQLRSPWLSEPSRSALADAVLAVSRP